MPEKVVKIIDAAKRSEVADGFENFVSRVGLQNNNTLSASLYEFNLITRNRLQVEAAYRGSWVVGQVIDTVAEDMTKAGINITTAEKTFDLKLVQRQITRLGISTSLCSFEKWKRLYGGAIAVLQIDGQDMSTPLDVSTVAKGQFKGLAVYDRWQVNPNLTNLIRSGPDLGMPRSYDIVTGWDASDPNNINAAGTVNVHHSRVIRGVGIQLPYFQAITEMMWGESVLERMWDRLISFDNATMSAANLIERANNRVLSIEGFREILAAGGDAQKGLEKSFELMREFQTNEGLTLLDKSDVFATYNYTFSGLSDIMLQFGQQVSGATGIPLVRLFGQSPSGLSATGDSDLRTYYDNINSKQIASLTGPWELILKVMWPSIFGSPLPEDLDFSFVPLWQMSDMDRATINQTNTNTVVAAEETGLVKRSTAMKELRAMAGDGGLFSNITDEDIEEAEENDDPPIPDLVKPTPDPVVNPGSEVTGSAKDSVARKFAKWLTK